VRQKGEASPRVESRSSLRSTQTSKSRTIQSRTVQASARPISGLEAESHSRILRERSWSLGVALQLSDSGEDSGHNPITADGVERKCPQYLLARALE
jgi:hypothetical protein